MREHLVVPPIHSRKVAGAQRSGIRHCEGALQPLDFSNALFSVHPVTISNRKAGRSIRSGISKDRDCPICALPADPLAPAPRWQPKQFLWRCPPRMVI